MTRQEFESKLKAQTAEEQARKVCDPCQSPKEPAPSLIMGSKPRVRQGSWQCPSCKIWVIEPMFSACQECRLRKAASSLNVNCAPTGRNTNFRVEPHSEGEAPKYFPLPHLPEVLVLVEDESFPGMARYMRKLPDGHLGSIGE